MVSTALLESQVSSMSGMLAICNDEKLLIIPCCRTNIGTWCIFGVLWQSGVRLLVFAATVVPLLQHIPHACICSCKLVDQIVIYSQ